MIDRMVCTVSTVISAKCWHPCAISSRILLVQGVNQALWWNRLLESPFSRVQRSLHEDQVYGGTEVTEAWPGKLMLDGENGVFGLISW
jgi:hypothetical protein